jgi:hypothetical protein
LKERGKFFKKRGFAPLKHPFKFEALSFINGESKRDEASLIEYNSHSCGCLVEGSKGT